ncbi:MAG: phage tail tape measure protein [Elusimicrobiales bacterium]
MSQIMELALSFTAIDAAGGIISRLESRINSLGRAGAKVSADFEAMRGGFRRALEGAGIAYSGWKLMQPGVSAAMAMEDATLRTKSFLADGVKSASQLNTEMKRVSETAYKLSEKMPIAAVEAAAFQNSLLKEGFSLDMASGSAQTALALGRLRGNSDEGTRAMMELFRGQFGVDSAEKMNAALDWTAQAEADPAEVVAALQKSGLAMASHGVGLDSAVALAGLFREAHLARPGSKMESMMDNVLATWADTQSNPARWARQFGLSFFKGDKFIGFAALQEQLKTRFRNVSGAKRAGVFGEIFGGGADAAEFLFKAQRIEEFEAAAKKRAGAVAAFNDQNNSLANSLTKLGNAWHNSSGALYEPLLPAMTAPVAAAADRLAKTGAWLRDNPQIAAAGGLALAGGVAWGVARMLSGAWGMGKSALALRGGLSRFGLSLFGGNTIAGTMAGKAQEAITGVKPVFVTNWPSGFGPGGAAGGLVDQFGRPFPNSGGFAAGAAGGMLGNLAGKFGAIQGLGAGAALAAAPALTTAAILAAAGAGAGIGALVNASGVTDKLIDQLASAMQYANESKGQTDYTKNRIIELRIDAQGRIHTDTDAPDVKITVMRGLVETRGPKW